MPKAAYRSRVLTLKKTKLGESDLIYAFLKQDGSLVSAVAKGARKPTSPFATRLDLFSVNDVLIAPGRNLHVVSEARLVSSHDGLRGDSSFAIAAPVIDVLCRTAQPNLPLQRAFDMASSCLSWEESVGNDARACALTAAFLIKLSALLGYRPSLHECIGCAADQVGAGVGSSLDFSYTEGGVVCSQCRAHHDTVRVEAAVINWCSVLLGARFEQVAQMDAPLDVSFAIFQFLRRWYADAVGTRLSSLDYLMTCGLV